MFTRFVRRFSHAVQIKGQDKFRTRTPHKGVQDKNKEAKSKAKNNFENEHPTRGDKKENGEAKSKAKKKFEHENLTRGYKKKTGRPNQRPRKFSNTKTSQGGTRKKTRRPNQRLRKNSSTKTSQGGDKKKWEGQIKGQEQIRTCKPHKGVQEKNGEAKISRRGCSLAHPPATAFALFDRQKQPFPPIQIPQRSRPRGNGKERFTNTQCWKAGKESGYWPQLSAKPPTESGPATINTPYSEDSVCQKMKVMVCNGRLPDTV